MKAIQTKYLCPTNTKGARVKASCGCNQTDRQSVTMPWHHDWDPELNHVAAARELMRKLGWVGDSIIGSFNENYYHVLTNGKDYKHND